MATFVTFSSAINAQSLVEAAAGLPVGTQKAKYCADLATILGAVTFEITVAGSVVYRAASTGVLQSSAAGIALPSAFVEPAAINVANALTDATAAIKLTNAANSNIFVVVPLKAGSATNGFLTASGALTGAKAVRAGGVLLVPPPTLDINPSAPVLTGPAMTFERMFNNMYEASSMPLFGAPLKPRANVVMPVNFAAVVAMCNWQGADRTRFDEFFDAVTVYLHIYPGPLNSRYDKRIQVRNVRASIMSTADVWKDYPVVNRMIGELWTGNTTANLIGDARNESDGVSVKPTQSNHGYKLWPDSFYLVNERSALAASKSMQGCVEVRIINEDGSAYTGKDCQVVVQVGYDLFSTDRNVPTTAGGTGRYGRDIANYPKFMMDGGNSRWIAIDGSMGWTTVGVMGGYTDTLETRNGLNAPDPFGDLVTPYWAFSRAPYTLTEAQIRAKPPKWLTDTPSQPGGGATGATLTINEAVEGMTLPNDGNPHSYNSQMDLWDSSSIVMGNNAHSSGIPDWWQPNNPAMKTTVQDWPDFVPWFDVQHHDASGPVSNVGVIIRNFRCYLLDKRDNTWKLGAKLANNIGADYYVDYTVNPPKDPGKSGDAAKTTVDGGSAYSYSLANGCWLHGYGGRFNIKNIIGAVSNLGGVFVVFEGRAFALDGGSIGSANVMLASGGDWYPSGASARDLDPYVPGIGCGRHAKLSATTWRTMTFYTCSEAVLRANPPPLTF